MPKNINPANFYSAPSMDWLAALRMIETGLEILTYMDMLIIKVAQKLRVDGFEWVKYEDINEDFIKTYDENDDIGYFLKVDLKCSTLVK